MGKQKVDIPIEQLEMLAEKLQKLASAISEIVGQCKRADVKFIKTDGWPTAAKGVQHIIEQLAKFAGPDCVVHKMDATKVLLPGQKLPRTRYVRPKKKQQVKDEIKASRSAKTKPKRNND